MPLVSVEEVSGRVARRRFVELPFAMFRREPRWAPPLAAVEQARLDPDRQPFFTEGDGIYLLARRGGRIAGRITAHIAKAGDGQGWFGFFDVDDDAAVVADLLDRAADWLKEKGCTELRGPASFTSEQEEGVRVDGFDVPGTTGRQWHPEWYPAHLESAGLSPCADLPAWRHDTVSVSAVLAAPDPDLPTQAGRYADARLSLRVGGGRIAAVPDLAPALRQGPLELARQAKRAAWETATVVRLDGEPQTLVAKLSEQAGRAGYRSLIAPWTPDPSTKPETVHRLYERQL